MVRGTTYSLASLVIVRALNVISSIVVARLLGKNNLGMLSIVNNIVGMVALFATLGVPTALTKYVATYAAEDRRMVGSVVGTSFLTMLIPLSLLTAGLLLLAGNLAQGIYHEPALTPLIQVAALTLLVSSLGTGGFGQALLQGLKEVKRISLINILASAIGVPIVVALTIGFRLKGTIAAQLIIALLGVALIGQALFRGYSPRVRSAGWGKSVRPDWKFWPRLMNLAFPAFLSGLVMTPVLWITTTRLQKTHGFGDVGLFNICFGMYQMILLIPVAVGMPLVPVIAESDRDDRARLGRLTGTSLEMVVFVTMILASAIALFARPLIFLLYGPSYLEAFRPMILMAGGVFFHSLGYVVGHYFAGTGRMWTGMAFNLLWFASIIPLSWYLAGQYGVTGLGASFLISYAVLAVALLGYVKTVLRASIRYAALMAGLALLVAGFSYAVMTRLPGIYYAGAGIGVLLVVGVVDYWLLPAKPELHRALANLRTDIRHRLAGTQVPR